MILQLFGLTVLHYSNLSLVVIFIGTVGDFQYFPVSNQLNICSLYPKEVITVKVDKAILTLLSTFLRKTVHLCHAYPTCSVAVYTKHLTCLGFIQIYLCKTCLWNISISPHSLPALFLLCRSLLKVLKLMVFLSSLYLFGMPLFCCIELCATDILLLPFPQ